MLSLIRSNLSILPKLPLLQNLAATTPSNLFHTLTNAPKLLIPGSVSSVPACGFKVMGRVRRRCKDCFFVMREGRLYNICKTHPRHKQMLMQKAEKRTWQLTHATQGKFRPW